MINVADIIKERVTMLDICDMYGIEVNRAGKALCPFHSEKTPSLSIYSGGHKWTCFGCGESGDVIDFVVMMFGLTFPAALEKINSDFALNLPLNGDKSPSLRQYRQAQRLQRERERKKAKKEQAKSDYDVALAEYIRLDMQRIKYKPMTAYDVPDQRFLEALQKLSTAEHRLDMAEIKMREADK